MKRDSDFINFVRFPLAFMVVMLHSYVAVQGFHINEVDWNNLTGVDAYSLVGITFSHVLTQVAVPVFFFISGYLFYLGLQQWSWQKYADKLKHRIKTLLIPYLSWNSIMALITIGFMLFATLLYGKSIERIYTWFEETGGVTGIYWSNLSSIVVKENILGCSCQSTFPLLIPMWFIRDLMVIVGLSPVLWFLLKNTINIYSLNRSSMDYWSGNKCSGAVFYVSSVFHGGRAFSLNNVSFVETFTKVNRWVIMILFFILSIASVIFDGRTTTIGYITLSLWIIVALIIVVRLAEISIDRYPMFSKKISNLSGSTYFVFAFHGVIMSYVYNALWNIFGVKTDGGLIDATYIGDHPLNGILSYLFTPVLAVAISMMCYWVLKRILYKWSWPLTGK